MVLVLAVVACNGRENEGPCVGGECLCQDESNCDYFCADVPCDVVCARVSNCSGGCGDACFTSCTDTSNCDLGCDDDCGVECRRVSNCRVDCGADCDVSCANASVCEVTMISGQVTCSDVSDCDVRCRRPDGTEVAAEDCGGGRFACPGC